jgi:hypothetical protein
LPLISISGMSFSSFLLWLDKIIDHRLFFSSVLADCSLGSQTDKGCADTWGAGNGYFPLMKKYNMFDYGQPQAGPTVFLERDLSTT